MKNISISSIYCNENIENLIPVFFFVLNPKSKSKIYIGSGGRYLYEKYKNICEFRSFHLIEVKNVYLFELFFKVVLDNQKKLEIIDEFLEHLPIKWLDDRRIKFSFFDTQSKKWLEPKTPDFSSLQGYLDEGMGMNIRKAWDMGVTGENVTIHHLDNGISESHEDLGNNLRIMGRSNPNKDYPHHGTASVGLMIGRNNQLGVKGISYSSNLNFYSYEDSITSIPPHVQAGDIVSLNMQLNLNIQLKKDDLDDSNRKTFFPITHLMLNYELVKNLVDLGAVVITAAGNGNNDLSDPFNSSNFGDSGVILVGACSSINGRRASFSNYNDFHNRMLNSWEGSVTTLGYGALQNFEGGDRDYTDSYSGTSSATPLVAGALALIQSYYKKKSNDRVLNTQSMYELVSRTGYTKGIDYGIGVRPDVYAALLEIDRMFN